MCDLGLQGYLGGTQKQLIRRQINHVGLNYVIVEVEYLTREVECRTFRNFTYHNFISK